MKPGRRYVAPTARFNALSAEQRRQADEIDMTKPRRPGETLHQRDEEDATDFYLKGGKVAKFAAGGGSNYGKDYSKKVK